MSNVVYIYALCEPDNAEQVRYIGASANPERRLYGHVAVSQLDLDTPKNRWILQLKAQGQDPTLRILETSTQETWREAERRWIRTCLEQGARLTNTTLGGGGQAGGSDGEGWYEGEIGTKEASQISGIQAPNLIRLVKTGRIQGRFDGLYWVLEEQSLQEYLAERALKKRLLQLQAEDGIAKRQLPAR